MSESAVLFVSLFLSLNCVVTIDSAVGRSSEKLYRLVSMHARCLSEPVYVNVVLYDEIIPKDDVIWKVFTDVCPMKVCVAPKLDL